MTLQNKLAPPVEEIKSSRWQIFNEATIALSKADTPEILLDVVTQYFNKMGFSVAIGKVLTDTNTLTLIKLGLLLPPDFNTQPAFNSKSLLNGQSVPLKDLPCYKTGAHNGKIEFVTLNPQLLELFFGPTTESLLSSIPTVQDQKVAAISIPIFLEETIEYLIFVSSDSISPDDIPGITAFANLTAAIMEKHILYQRTEEQKQIAETLQEVSNIVSSSLNLETVLSRILEQLATVIRYDSAAILLEDNNALKIEAGQGFEHSEDVLDVAVAADTNVLYQEMRQKRLPIIINDVHTDPRYDLWAGTGSIRSWIGVPLIWQEEVIGQISIDSFIQNAFNPEDGKLAFAFARHVATAIQNARLFYQQTQTANELRALLDSARDATTTLDTEKIIYLMANRVKSLMKASAVVVYLAQSETDIMDPVIQLSDVNEVVVARDNQKIVDRAIETRTGIINNGPTNNVDIIQAFMAVPFVVNNQVIGVITITRLGEIKFKQDDLDLLTRFALQSGIAIENSRLHGQVERRLHREALLNQLSQRLSSNLTLDSLITDIMQTGQTMAEADAAALVLVDPANDKRFIQFVHNLQPQSHPVQLEVAPGLVSHILSNQKILFTHQLSQESYAQPRWVAIEVQGVIGIPLTSNNKTLGVLGLFTINRPFSNPAEILTTLESVGRQAGVSIENALLFKQVNDYANNLAEQVEARTAEIRTEKEKIDAILAGAADAILITNSDGTIEYVNPAFTNLTGYFPEEVIGKNPNLLSSGQTVPHVYRQMWHTITSGKVWRGELKNKRKDNSLYDAELTIAPIFNYLGQIDNFVAIQRDISKLRELDRLKTEFLGTAAHELRGPLTTIRGYAELLLARDRFSRDDMLRFIHDIHESAVHLSNLIKDLLDVSKIEAGAAFGISPEFLNPQAIFERTVNIWQERAENHNIVLHPPEEWPEVEVDPARLEQLIENLISNAVKYSPDGGDVTVSVHRTAGNLRISVSDEGIGMTVEEQKHVFEKFWRADASSTAIEGTGLGMVIVKHIVESHGGKIWVTSRKEEGTTISFTIPLTTGLATILIIEDEASILEIQQRLLHMEGYQVITATTGAMGLKLAQAEHPDLIILDLMLPETTGEEILRQLKAIPATEHIPVVIVSAKAGLAHIENTFALGAVDFLTKPFEIDEYLGRIKIALNK